jgi:hypothetical protein
LWDRRCLYVESSIALMQHCQAVFSATSTASFMRRAFVSDFAE